MKREFRSWGIIGLLTAGISASACKGSTCDDSECVSAVSVVVEGSFAAGTVIEFETPAGTERCSASQGAGGDTATIDFECSYPGLLWFGDGTFSLREAPERLTVRVVAEGEVIAEEAFTPRYVAKDEECHPGCQHAEVTFSVE